MARLVFRAMAVRLSTLRCPIRQRLHLTRREISTSPMKPTTLCARQITRDAYPRWWAPARLPGGGAGAATAATFLFPTDVQADSAGNVYLTEGGRVHKISPSGIITTLLSFGPNNFVAGGSSHFAVDNQGNIYITRFDRVLKLNTSGAVTVVAGTGTAVPGDGGLATLAKLQNIRGLAVDFAGNLYIADPQNKRVRKVDLNGIITTVAGNGTTSVSGDGGPATSAGVPNPFALTVDGAGNLFIGSGGSVRKVDAGGLISTIAGGGFIGPTVDGISATNAAFTNIQGLAFNATGNL